MCRRWGGGPYLSLHCGRDVKFGGIEHVSTFRSSEWAERAFCRHCGTHLYYKLLPTGDHEMPVGLFQHEAAFEFTEQIFIDHKPSFYSFADDTVNRTEAEVFAEFARSQQGRAS